MPYAQRKRALAADPDWQDPYYWAGWVLIGDASRMRVSRSWFSRYWRGSPRAASAGRVSVTAIGRNASVPPLQGRSAKIVVPELCDRRLKVRGARKTEKFRTNSGHSSRSELTPSPDQSLPSEPMEVPARNPSDEELLEAALASTGEVRNRHLGLLFQRHYDQVARWCLRFAGNQDDALDLAQEVFVKAHRSLDSFRGNSRVSTWLYTIARRTFLDLTRSRGRKPTDLLDQELEETLEEEGVDLLADLEATERAQTLRRAMMKNLDARERKALCLRYIDGMTVSQITDFMALENRSGAKALLVSAFRKLRRDVELRPIGRSV